MAWFGTGSNRRPGVVSLTSFTDTLNNRQLRKYGSVHEIKQCALYMENFYIQNTFIRNISKYTWFYVSHSTCNAEWVASGQWLPYTIRFNKT